MPKVGKMKFPYTEQGMKEAANYAKNSGKSMQVEGNYRKGGIVPVPGIMPQVDADDRFLLKRGIPAPNPGEGMVPPVNPGTMGGSSSEGIAPGMDDTGAGQKYYDRPIGSYQYGGMVPNQPINPRFRYGFRGGPGQGLQRSAPRPPGQNAPQGFNVQNYSGTPPYGPHRGNPMSPSLGNPGPSPVSPRPPIAGRGGSGAGRMSPRQLMALRNRLAKFKKGIV